MQIVVTGIGTDVGKTVVSAILAEAIQASYWKPIQAGDLGNSDSIRIAQLTENVEVLPEAYRLNHPMSPHAAAALDEVNIELDKLDLPSVEGNLVLEGAGGLMVPYNEKGNTFLDLILHWDLPVVLVSRHYLGSINHTLLTVKVLEDAGVEIKGIVFVGDEHPTTEHIILSSTCLNMIARIPETDIVNRDFVLKQARLIKDAL